MGVDYIKCTVCQEIDCTNNFPNCQLCGEMFDECEYCYDKAFHKISVDKLNNDDREYLKNVKKKTVILCKYCMSSYKPASGHAKCYVNSCKNYSNSFVLSGLSDGDANEMLCDKHLSELRKFYNNMKSQ